MQDHLQSLVSQGFVTVMELVTCRVPEDAASLVLAKGYMVVFGGIL
jgi:hypothetical protein